MLQLLKMASEDSALLNTHGSLMFHECRDVTLVDPVSITNPDEFIRLDVPEGSRKFLSITFTTIERDGLMMYTSGEGCVL